MMHGGEPLLFCCEYMPYGSSGRRSIREKIGFARNMRLRTEYVQRVRTACPRTALNRVFYCVDTQCVHAGRTSYVGAYSEAKNIFLVIERHPLRP